MFPPSNLICSVTIASPIHTMAKTPEKMAYFCLGWPQILNSTDSNRQKIRGPHKSQSLRPGVMLFWLSKDSGSMTLPARDCSSSRAPESPAPRRLAYAPRNPPLAMPLSSIEPPNRYRGYSTSRILDQTARRSRRTVSHTVSSIVFCGARRSSPGIRDVRKDSLSGLEDADDVPACPPMLPVKGARCDSALDKGSSKSLRSAVGAVREHLLARCHPPLRRSSARPSLELAACSAEQQQTPCSRPQTTRGCFNSRLTIIWVNEVILILDVRAVVLVA